MLIRFSVTNYLSFFELTDFNMVSGDVRSKKNHIENINGVELLKFSLLYGANGAGKSNLIRSVEAVREIIKSEEVRDISEDSHKFDPACYDKPTTFELELVSSSGRPFIYGIAIVNDLIQNEYLYQSGLGKSKDKLIFERFKVDKNKSRFDIDKKYISKKSDRDFLHLFGASIINNSMVALPKFLSFEENLVDFNKVLYEVYEWMINGLRIIHPSSKPAGLLFNLSNHHHFLNFSNDLLSSIDLGIKALHIKTYDLDDFFGEDDKEKKYKKQVIEELEEDEFVPLAFDLIAVKEEVEGEEMYYIKKLLIEHSGKKDAGIQFSLYEESDGTKRVIEYLSMIFEILSPKFNGVYLVDEIERSIHPHLLKEMLKKLVDSEEITGQLIFTTHESNLLDLDLFRQDEIWLTEKNESGATSFSPMSDYKIRNDLDIRKGYLKGRFGAIPMLGNLQNLNWYRYATD